jgi:redox-sensing transcriptional repressor
MTASRTVPIKTIERLILYKRLLQDHLSKGEKFLYSYQLAELAHNTSAQVRRDLMAIGFTGKAGKGYSAEELISRISFVLEEGQDVKTVLVGIGNLGRAILSYFIYKHPGLEIVAAFDADPTKTDRVIAGCRCYHIRDFDAKVKELGAALGIITVPANNAQEAADLMAAAGIKGIINFAPVPLKLPDDVFSERIDITMALEKIAYFASRKK